MMTVNDRNEFDQPVGFPLLHWRAPESPARIPMQGRFCQLEPLNPQQHGFALYQSNQRDPDDRAWTYLPYGPFSDDTMYMEWLEQQAAAHDPLFFAIVDGSGQAVGLASYLRIDAAMGVIEVGHLKFSSALQRTPAATEAMYLMMQNVFNQGYRRYEWKCDALNLPSRRAAERLGFRFEGIFRQARIVKGRNRDTAWFSITDAEWPVLQAGFQRWLAPENFDEHGRQRHGLAELRHGCLDS